MGNLQETNIYGNLYLSDTAVRNIGLLRQTTGNGRDLTISAGGAQVTGINLSGGSLILSSGISTGSGSSYVSIYTATAGVSGTTDNSLTEKVRITGGGDVETIKGTYQYHRQTLGTNTTGDWRYYVSGDNFIFERYDGTNWIEKSKIMN